MAGEGYGYEQATLTRNCHACSVSFPLNPDQNLYTFDADHQTITLIFDNFCHVSLFALFCKDGQHRFFGNVVNFVAFDAIGAKGANKLCLGRFSISSRNMGKSANLERRNVSPQCKSGGEGGREIGNEEGRGGEGGGGGKSRGAPT